MPKTTGMVFSRGRIQKNNHIEIMVNGQKINTITTTRFLEMDLDQQLGWCKHIQRLTESCNGLNNIMRYIKGNG
jgi:hypothetical protein